jgi:hypothetical protein
MRGASVSSLLCLGTTSSARSRSSPFRNAGGQLPAAHIEELHKYCRAFSHRDDQVRDRNTVREHRLEDGNAAPRRAVNSGPLLRLQADDPAVLERTGRALADSQHIGRPPLSFTCDQCGRTLARVGDTAHGPLFTSSWEIPAPNGARAGLAVRSGKLEGRDFG